MFRRLAFLLLLPLALLAACQSASSDPAPAPAPTLAGMSESQAAGIAIRVADESVPVSNNDVTRYHAGKVERLSNGWRVEVEPNIEIGVQPNTPAAVIILDTGETQFIPAK